MTLSTGDQHIVSNLRRRWQDQLQGYTDEAIAALYRDFSQSDEFGDNDRNFPSWFELLPLPSLGLAAGNDQWVKDRYLTPLSHYADGLITSDEMLDRLLLAMKGE